MENLILFTFFSLFAITTLKAEPNYKEKWHQANEAYEQEDFVKAGQLYSALVDGDHISSDVYYNLGNCYFKQDELALAILNYNRALLLDPANGNIRHNLEIATTQTTDRIEKLPTFFLNDWVDSLKLAFSSNNWALISVITFMTIFIMYILFHFSKRPFIRKISFTICWLSIFAFIVSLTLSISSMNNIQNSKIAIVMNNAVAVKSSPSEGGTDLFVLNQGAKVTVKETLGEWSEITVDSGNSGWVNHSTIEYIKPVK